MSKLPVRWAIAYIDSANLHYLQSDLRKHAKYNVIQAYIPTINILRKKLKGKNHFEQVPLLFNYGFFRVPKYFIPNPHFLDAMKADIRCLYAWVIDPVVLKTKVTPDMKIGLYNPKGIALAKDNEIENLKNQEKLQSIYSAKDIDTLFEGKIIVLKKYPFENLPATIVTIDHAQKRAKVKLNLDTPMAEKPITVSFDNIFYSAYETYKDFDMREESIEVIKAKYKNFEGRNNENRD